MAEKIWYWDRKSYQEYQDRERKAYKNLFASKGTHETDVKSPLREYPLNTTMAASELKRRGIDCNAKQLAYMASKGIVQPDVVI